MAEKRRRSCQEPEGVGPGRRACPFLPWFLLHNIIFDHLPGRWSRARPDAGSRNRAPRSCRQPLVHCANTFAPDTARGATGQVGSRRLGAMVSVCRQGQEPEHWEWDLDEAGGCCPSVLEPPLSLQPDVSFQPRFPLQELPSQPRCPHLEVTSPSATGSLSQRRAKHQKSVHSGNHCASCSVELVLARSILAQEPAAAVLQCRHQPNPGMWALWSEAAARGEIACAGRPLGTQHGRSRNCPTPERRSPHVGRGRRPPRGPALANTAGCAALRTRTDGTIAAAVSSEHKVASVPRNKKLSTSHHFPAIISPRHSTHPTILIFNPLTVLFQNWVSHFLSSATWHLGRPLDTFKCTQPTERARNFAPWYSGKMSRSGNGWSPEGGTTAGGVKSRTHSFGSGEQHSSEVSKHRRQTPSHAKKRIWPAQRKRWRTTCSPTTAVRSLQWAPWCHSTAIPDAPLQFGQRTRSSTRIPCGIGSRHPRRRRRPPRRQPQKRCSNCAPFNIITGWTPKTPASHSADSGPDSRPKPAATIAHPNSCP